MSLEVSSLEEGRKWSWNPSDCCVCLAILAGRCRGQSASLIKHKQQTERHYSSCHHALKHNLLRLKKMIEGFFICPRSCRCPCSLAGTDINSWWPRGSFHPLNRTHESQSTQPNGGRSGQHETHGWEQTSAFKKHSPLSFVIVLSSTKRAWKWIWTCRLWLKKQGLITPMKKKWYCSRSLKNVSWLVPHSSLPHRVRDCTSSTRPTKSLSGIYGCWKEIMSQLKWQNNCFNISWRGMARSPNVFFVHAGWKKRDCTLNIKFT